MMREVDISYLTLKQANEFIWKVYVHSIERNQYIEFHVRREEGRVYLCGTMD